MPTISEWDASEHIRDEQDAIAYLNAAAELGDPAVLQAAIEDVTKAHGTTSRSNAPASDG